ncbi:5-oxoprolinase subunit C family protein [Aestuariivivens sediminicola]|uniref:5-oxoprolinase subunit C family protein n=1 Tax=Aestuariivivens sediminicola TaxID=2913560 RepID=UPI001F59A27E|nr:biotin-dependent carboxyltransferase family protein [Aestuariivivens sediminicola]
MIKVIDPGFFSTIQDMGRYGVQGYGIPRSGVMDRYASGLVNALLGNAKGAPVLEITMVGPVLEFTTPTLICISGALMQPALNGDPIDNNSVIAVGEGDILSFGKLKKGFRSYLGVLGGFQTEFILGSYSMYKAITEQASLAKGDTLHSAQKQDIDMEGHSKLRVNTSYLNISVIEVYKGPEFDNLSQAQQKRLFSRSYTISKNNSRMAYQLEERIKNELNPIITSPVLPGTVQLTPSGQLIILMRDCQTTGGYPRVLQLKAASDDILSQKFTGEQIKFNLITI